MSDHDKQLVPSPKGLVTSVGRQLAVTEKLLVNQLNSPLLVPQFWHPGSITSIAISPDSKTIAFVDQDYAVQLWDIEIGACLRVLVGQSEEIHAIAFSPGGRMIAALGWSGHIVRWEVVEGKLLNEFNWSSGEIKTIAFTSDDQVIGLVKDGDKISIWDIEKEFCLQVLDESSVNIFRAAFSPDGRLVFAVFKNSTIVLWETESGKCLFRAEDCWLDPDEIADFHPALSNGGQMIAKGGNVREILSWYTGSTECLRVIKVLSLKEKVPVAFSFDGRMVAAGGTGNISLWDVETGACLRELGYSAKIKSVSFSSDNQLIVLGSWNRIDCFREAGNRNTSRSLEYGLPQDSDVVFAPGGEIVAVMSGGTIQICETSSGRCIQILAAHSGWVRSVTFSPDGMTLASVGNDDIVRLWDINSGKCKLVLNAQSVGIGSVTISPDGLTLASVGEDDTLRLWAVDSGECLWETNDPNLELLTFVEFSPDGQTVVSVADECIICLWSTVSGELIKVVDFGEERIDSVYFFDGRTIIGRNEGVFFLDIENGEYLWKNVRLWSSLRLWLSLRDVFAISPDGRLIALGYGDGKIQLLKVSTGDYLADIFFFPDDSWAVITPDGRYDSSDFGESPWLRWTVSLKSYPVTKFKGRYYTPGLLAQLTANG